MANALNSELPPARPLPGLSGIWGVGARGCQGLPGWLSAGDAVAGASARPCHRRTTRTDPVAGWDPPTFEPCVCARVCVQARKARRDPPGPLFFLLQLNYNQPL